MKTIDDELDDAIALVAEDLSELGNAVLEDIVEAAMEEVTVTLVLCYKGICTIHSNEENINQFTKLMGAIHEEDSLLH